MDRKQSAFARRLNKNLETFTGSVDNSTNKTLSSHILYSSQNFSDISNKLQSVSLSTVSNYSEFMVEKDLSNPLSWESRITDLENNPSGGGGIDPSDPDQPIIIVDNFIRQPNGDPSGTGGLFIYPDGNTTILNTNGLPILFTESETDHNGIIIVRLSQFDTNINYYILGQIATADVCKFTDVSTLYYIIKTPATLQHSIRIGFMDDYSSSPSANEICFERLTGEANISVVTRSSGTQTKTSSGIAYSANTWYIFKIARTVSNTVDFTINTTTVNQTTNIPIGFMNVGVQIQGNGSNSADEDFKFDFFSLKLGDVAAVIPTGTTVVGTTNEVEVTTVGSVITVGLPASITVTEANLTNVNFVTTTTNPTPVKGQLIWDDSHGTVVIGVNNNVHIPLGEASMINVRNSSASNILKGEIVYVSGSHSTGYLEVTKAQANAEATSAPTVGLAAEDIAINATGFVITQGLLTGLTTTAYSAGQPIFLSESTAGGWRTSFPTAPNHGTFVGWIVKSAGGGAGSIFVKIHNYNELSELSDVYIPSTPSNNDVLQWTTANSRWENKSLSSAGIAASSHTHTLSNITQSGASLNQVPQWNGTAWVANSISGGFTPQRTVFASSGSFTIPSGANMLRIICVGGGGGGGGGCLSNSTSSNRCGGAGGGGGSVNIATYLVSTLASPLTITIGTGGSQGGGAVTNGSNGSNGGPGGVTTVTSPSFNGIAGTTRICWGANGLGGSGGAVGSTSSTAGGGGAQGYTGGAGGNGASGTGSIGNQTSSSGGLSFSPYGGGGGGGINSSNTHSAGGNCFGMYPFNDSNTTAGTAGGGAGPAATATRGTSHDWGNVGGSGGGGNNAGAGGAGGAGIYGSGGGGGGAGSSTNGGTGGLGGSGLVIIYSL